MIKMPLPRNGEFLVEDVRKCCDEFENLTYDQLYRICELLSMCVTVCTDKGDLGLCTVHDYANAIESDVDDIQDSIDSIQNLICKLKGQ